MKAFNFFKFLEDTKGIEMPIEVQFLDPDYVFNVEDFQDEMGNVILVNTAVSSLPDNLTIKGNLHLGHTSIKVLPDNLTVGGSLILVYTPIEELPNNLSVGKDLFLGYTKVTSLPADLKVGGNLLLGPTVPLFQKYSEEEIRQMAPGIKGDVYTNI